MLGRYKAGYDVTGLGARHIESGLPGIPRIIAEFPVIKVDVSHCEPQVHDDEGNSINNRRTFHLPFGLRGGK
jgi:hypothetical protein